MLHRGSDRRPLTPTPPPARTLFLPIPHARAGPRCHEKVNLQEICKASPWFSRSLLWVQLLDAVRYLIVVAPLILILVQQVIKHWATSTTTSTITDN